MMLLAAVVMEFLYSSVTATVSSLTSANVVFKSVSAVVITVASAASPPVCVASVIKSPKYFLYPLVPRFTVNAGGATLVDMLAVPLFCVAYT